MENDVTIKLLKMKPHIPSEKSKLILYILPILNFLMILPSMGIIRSDMQCSEKM